MARNSSGNRGDVRQSALWGSGNRGGELRSNALWGKGGRGLVVLMLLALAMPLAATAGDGKGKRERDRKIDRLELGAYLPAMAEPAAGSAQDDRTARGTRVDKGLLQKASEHPDATVRVIIRAKEGIDSADKAGRGLGRLTHKLGLIGAVAMELSAKEIEKLARIPGLTITVDEPTELDDDDGKRGRGDEERGRGDDKRDRDDEKQDRGEEKQDRGDDKRDHDDEKQDRDDDKQDSDDGRVETDVAYGSGQLWPYQAGFNKLWNGPQAPTIAIVDSGMDANRRDFGDRVLEQVSFVSSGKPNTPGDGRGHGTFVAGIAAGSAPGYTGVAPNARLVSLDVMDDSGSGFTSDVIKAAEWIVQNKEKYNIRVANFSLHSGNISRFYDDPLNLAINKLWFNGIVVVTAAGNYGSQAGPSGVPHSPGNNPFVITVGALDIKGTHNHKDDAQAPWSAYGRTPDGFWKPEICAAGRYMVGPIPDGSTLALAKAANKKAPGYIELSGTSFSTSVVSGLAAQLLARSPHFTPDQVKGALMAGARDVPEGAKHACGVGQVNAVKTGFAREAPNPNAALNEFLIAAPDGSGTVFDAVSWSNVSWSNVSWSNVSWSNVSWSGVSWDAVSWSNVSWSNVSWDAVSWSNFSAEDNAGDEASGADDAYELSPEEAAAAALDPDLVVP